MQQLVAEAFLQQGRTFFGADLSIQNGGGVRTDLAKGAITVKDVYTVLPFKNTLVQLNATGQEIKEALEDALEGVVGPALNTGCYPYAGGLRWQPPQVQAGELTMARSASVSRMRTWRCLTSTMPSSANFEKVRLTVSSLRPR